VRLYSPPGYPHAAGLAELAETLEAGLAGLGMADEPLIFLGAHLPGARVPSGAIIYNTEHPQSPWANAAYHTLCCAHEVWSYYQGGPGRYVPIGYMPALTRIPRADPQDIDVLFYGSVNERRLDVLLELRSRGLHVEPVTGVYGAERDALVARAKVVLNLHYYLPGIFEAVRVSYLWANRKAVVCEASDDGKGGLLYANLANACQVLVVDDARRWAFEGMSFETFTRQDEVAILKEALCTPVS
jgi:hypothetical protein